MFQQAIHEICANPFEYQDMRLYAVAPPYIFTNPETGEEMELSHTYTYNEDPASIEEEVLG